MILKLNGQPIADSSTLSMRVNTTPPGEKVTLDIWRDGKAKSLTARIRSASAETVASNDPAKAEQTQLGLALRPLSPDEREQVGVEHGLVVEGAQGKAAAAGIQEGDVVIGVDGTPIESVDQLRKIVKDHKKQVALLIQRGEDRIFVPIALG